MSDVGIGFPHMPPGSFDPPWLLDLRAMAYGIVESLGILHNCQDQSVLEQLQPDYWWLARALKAETSWADWGSQLSVVSKWLAWSIVMRQRSSEYPMTMRGVLSQSNVVRPFHMTEWTANEFLDMADEFLSTTMGDGGPLFVLSDVDLDAFGIVDVGVKIPSEDGLHSMYAYWYNPFGDGWYVL